MNPDRWKEVNTLFHAALEIAPSERHSFVLKASRGDTDLQGEVEALLRADEDAGSYLEDTLLPSQSVTPPAPGTDIDGYQIIARLGAGGMGEVYRARDPALKRAVAIKVLPSSVAQDPVRLRRFQQEAQAAAALNHPNILAVYRFGLYSGAPYIVSELLEGSTLRQLLEHGPVPVRKAIDYAIQIAHGLAAAHEQNIIHRDLKPENLFVTKEGRVKILDFGLAKLTQHSSAYEGNAPTLKDATEPGMVMGTVGYMSPEQVRGPEIDHRSDIFAFGAILYEMLAGNRAFRKPTSAETMSAILNDEPPDLSQCAPSIPPALQRIVRRCMEKNPAERFHSASDLAFALEALSNPDTGGLETRGVHSSKKPSRFGKTASVIAVVVLLTGLLALLWARVFKSHQVLYERVTFRKGAISAARFSPDEHTIIYSAAWGSPTTKLYRSDVDGTDMRPLDLPPGDLLAVSHSGELAISEPEGRDQESAAGRLAQARLTGGAPRELLDNVIEADWSPDGAQLAIVRTENGKCRLEYPVGNVLYETVGYISHMRISPKGNAIAFMDHPVDTDDRGTVSMVDLKGRKRTLTGKWEGEQGLAWSPDGAEIWFTATNAEDWDRHLYAVSRSGKQRLVLNIPGALYLEDIASDGRVLFRREDRHYEVAAGTIGTGTKLISWTELMEAASISRDGKYALLTDTGMAGDSDLYLANLDGSPPVQLGKGIGSDISPDDNWVTSILRSDWSKVLLLPTGVGSTKSIAVPNFHYRAALWTSNGRELVVLANESDRPFRYWVQGLDGGSPRAITPEGIIGRFVTVNHSDYISAQDTSGAVRLYPIDGGEPKLVSGLAPSDEVIGGSTDSEVLYVRPKLSGIPPEPIMKVNLATGRREAFLNIVPTDPPGVVSVGRPRFSNDGKRFVYNQVRELSVLYVASGLN